MPRINSIATPKQRAALQHLAGAAHGHRLTEAPFVTLPDDIPTITIKKMLERDWIVPSMWAEAVTYKITGRGLKILETIAAQQARSARVGSPICRMEGCDNPVYICKGKYRRSLCQSHYQEQARQRYAEGKVRLDPKKPCSKCGGERCVTKTGYVHAYCRACLYTVNRGYRDRYQAEVKEALERGETPRCKKVGCAEPVTFFPGGRASRYCRECQRIEWRTWIKRYKTKKRRARYAAILKKS